MMVTAGEAMTSPSLPLQEGQALLGVIRGENAAEDGKEGGHGFRGQGHGVLAAVGYLCADGPGGGLDGAVHQLLAVDGGKGVDGELQAGVLLAAFLHYRLDVAQLDTALVFQVQAPGSWSGGSSSGPR